MEVAYSKQFSVQFEKSDVFVQRKFKDRLELFLKDQRAEQLRIHKLHGTYNGTLSMNITGDIRAVFVYIDVGRVMFLAIGSHSQLYS